MNALGGELAMGKELDFGWTLSLVGSDQRSISPNLCYRTTQEHLGMSYSETFG